MQGVSMPPVRGSDPCSIENSSPVAAGRRKVLACPRPTRARGHMSAKAKGKKKKEDEKGKSERDQH